MTRSHQESLTKYLSKKPKKILINLPTIVHKELVILAQELGQGVGDTILIAVIRFLKRQENRELIEQSNYSKVDEVDKIFSEL